jgi:hypothetical protein
MAGTLRRIFGRGDVVALVRRSRPPEADLTVQVDEQARQAEWRWHHNNAEAKARGCPCGGPAEVARRHSVVGTVPYEWWTCAEHAGASGFSGGTALFQHDQPCPLGEDRMSGGPIGGPTEHWSCPHREHEAQP